MKGGKYSKTIAKIQASAVFHIRDIRRNVLPKFIEICIDMPCWCPSRWAPTQRTKINRNICYWVLKRKREFLSRGIHKQETNTFCNTWTVQIAIFHKISNFFNRIKMTALSAVTLMLLRKSLEIQAYSITKPRTLFGGENLYEYYFSAALINHESKISVGSIVL